MKTKRTGIALTLAAVILRAASAAGAGSPCQAKTDASASRVRAATSAFTAALGADARNRFPDGFRAAVYALVYVDCVGGVGIASVPAGYPAGAAACQTASVSAEAADPASSPRISSTAAGDPYAGVMLASERSAGFLKSFLTRPVPDPVRQSASALLAAVEEGASTLRGCAAEFSKPVLERKIMPAPPAPPPALTSFDGYLGTAFTVHLDSGKATVGSAEATLEGGVTISPRTDPSLKLTVNGRVVLKARQPSSSGPGGSAAEQENARAMMLGAAQIGTWASVEGQGSVRISGFGPAVITIPSAALGSQSSIVTLTGGEASLRGCTHTLAAGSAFTSSQVLLEGSLKCGPWTLTASSMGMDKTSVAGGGTLSAWSKSFTMTYAASGDGLAARGALTGADTPWVRVPGFEAEWRIEAPRLDLKLDGSSLSPTFGAGKVTVRTTAKKPDGSPWSLASMTPATVVVPAPPTDGIPVPFPVLPAPTDAEKAARDACVQVADRTTTGKAHDAAVGLCNSSHPSPPSVPALPRTVSLKVGDVFR